MLSSRALSSLAARCRAPPSRPARSRGRRCRTTAAPLAPRPSPALPPARARRPAPPLPPTTLFRRPISDTAPLRAEVTVAVPSMGDSITEGTIVEWCVAPGAHVREGDVLALIETDKVTVDIKAEAEGVLVKQLGEAEAEVEVGQGLYVIETDAGAVERAKVERGVAALNMALDAEGPGEEAREEARVAAPPTVPASAPASTSTPASAAARVPSIHFLGKAGWKERRTIPEAVPAAPLPPHAPTSTTAVPHTALYRRLPITEEEMEALILGGAEEAPEATVVAEGGVRGVAFAGGRVVTTGPRGVWLAAEY